MYHSFTCFYAWALGLVNVFTDSDSRESVRWLFVLNGWLHLTTIEGYIMDLANNVTVDKIIDSLLRISPVFDSYNSDLLEVDDS